ncbi:hypothetical protein [Microbacterium resistens]|uniref:Uncharacterized protein n=1 Tax=Microbacterium resistens TaxID=156977 RepID=A0ABY3RMY4_9MICO|nr:hypothetical protein [Microbacterium resistens]MBW1638733.1 hypothetical protein [Microbacterium resistens]MDA4896029.1 hypothetical protein [Streptomyces sp. MS2A]UGS25094.1 hypothetical protein K8F61_10295 [Microbacterium resistens]
MQTPRRTGLRILVTLGFLVLGIVVGLILQNVVLALVLAAFIWTIWFLGFETRRGRNTGVNDEDNGIQL